MILKVGDIFTSFEGFLGALEIFQTETDSEFSISDSRLLQARRPKRAVNAPENLKYSNIKYTCIHGGNCNKSRSRNIRNTSTVKVGCDAFIYLTLTADAQALEIKRLNLVHCHDKNPHLMDISKQKRNMRKIRIKFKDLKDDTEERLLKKRRKLYIEKKREKEAAEAEKLQSSFSTIQSLPDINAKNLNEEPQITEPNETEMISYADPDETVFLPEGTQVVQSGDSLCKCGFGTWELTKQDLMLMEVEEHHHRLDILQLEEAFQIEQIEKMRYLNDLKIQKAQIEIQIRNKENK